MTQSMVTLQVYRLEVDEGSHFKHYTVFAGPGYCFFGFARIGGPTWQWSIKNGPDALRIAQRQLDAKRAKGYGDVWSGDITVPELWAQDPKAHARELQDFTDRARREGRPHTSASSETTVGEPETDVATPLSGLLSDAARTVSKMAVDPDTAIQDYAALVGSVEAAREDLSVVEGYLDTLKIMLAAGEAQIA